MPIQDAKQIHPDSHSTALAALKYLAAGDFPFTPSPPYAYSRLEGDGDEDERGRIARHMCAVQCTASAAVAGLSVISLQPWLYV